MSVKLVYNGTTLGGGANHVLRRKLMGVFVRFGERMHYVAMFQTVFLGRLGGFGPVVSPGIRP